MTYKYYICDMSAAIHMKLLSKLDPVLYNQIKASSTPVMTDTERIPTIYSQFSNMFALEKDPLMKKLKFISVILRLYSPASLIAEVRVKDGVCSNLTTALGYGDVSNISHMIARARAYMTVQAFRSDVENIADWISGREGA